MPRSKTTFAPRTAKEATARILFAEKDQSAGSGLLLHGGLIATCAHVVTCVCGAEAGEGATLGFTLPFADPLFGAPISASVAKGGWLPDKDIAFLRIDPVSGIERGFNGLRFISDADEEPLDCWGFGESFDPDGDNAELKLPRNSLQARKPFASLRRKDDSGALYVEGGFSGAPVVDKNGQVVGLLSGDKEVEGKDGGVKRYAVRLVLAHALDEHWPGLLSTGAPGETVDPVDEVDSLVAAMRDCLADFKKQNQHTQIASQIEGQLNFLVTTIRDPDQWGSTKNQIRELERAWRDVRATPYADSFSAAPFGALPRMLAALVPALRTDPADGREGVDNNWQMDDTLPHARLVPELLREIEARLNQLQNGVLRLDKPIRDAAIETLQNLWSLLHRQQLSLRELDDIRASLEALDRDIFRELITACQLVLGRHAARLPDFAIFRERLKDGAAGPEMVAIPEGNFLMGSALGEDELGEDDKAWEDEIVPRQGKRRMRIAQRFALGRYPVTFAEYDLFCAATGSARPDNEQWGRDRRPVINVSWDDADAYIGWLNTQLSLAPDKGYRLPSETEWEYACRAGTDTRRWWGDAWDAAKANGAGSFEGGRTSPVDHYAPNTWGLHDTIGNVWEWCADVWVVNIAELPDDGAPNKGNPSPAENNVQAHRVLRGGSWNNFPRNLRSASRNWFQPDDRTDFIGFRLSRTL